MILARLVVSVSTTAYRLYHTDIGTKLVRGMGGILTLGMPNWVLYRACQYCNMMLLIWDLVPRWQTKDFSLIDIQDVHF